MKHRFGMFYAYHIIIKKMNNSSNGGEIKDSSIFLGNCWSEDFHSKVMRIFPSIF